MYLRALRLHGFKSFADSTTLRFEPGVTAVVGPNGCGKSNIADAIRWVLGEQSAKALRGGRMQDVIFEGVDSRKPAQLCEVSLLLTECEKQLGSEFHEIEIMRRVHRDGQSEYFFNGQVCRLKDIHKLFMDTGIGRTSYSIMAQGQIDQVLSSKPEERRAVFEEAAGITKYKSQRREALNKLALTEQNMARVTDVIGEVGRQIGSMRRQAAKAMRYRRLGHRFRQLSLAWSGFHRAQLMTEVAALEERVNRLRSAANSRREALTARQSSLDARKNDRANLMQRVQEAQQAVFDLRSERESAENASALAQTRRGGLEERIEAARAHLGELEMQLREVSAEADSGAQDRQMQLGLLGTSDAQFQQRNRDVAVADGLVSRLDQDLQQARFELLQAESAVARLRSDCSGFEVEQKTASHRLELLDAELGKLRVQQDSAAAAAIALESRVDEAQQGRAGKLGEAESLRKDITDFTREFREAQRRLQEVDRQLAQRGARLKLLQQLQERWEGFGEGAKAVMHGKLDAALAGGTAVPILNGLTIRPEWGPALEALLGSAAEAISVSDSATAQRILSQLEAEKIGVAVLRVGDLGGAVTGDAAPPPGLMPATAALEGFDASHPVVGLLEGCYLAEDLAAVLEFWRANREFPFVAVATRRGERIDRAGLLSGGHRADATQAQSLVRREIDLRETARLLTDDQKLHADRRSEVDGIAERLTGAEQRLEAIRGELLAATQSVAAAQTEHRAARKSLEDAASRVGAMEKERATLSQACDEAKSRWENAQKGLAEADAAATAQRGNIKELEGKLEAARQDRDGKREALASARLELAEQRQKVEVLDRGLGEMEKRRQQLNDLLVQRHQEIEAWTEQRDGCDRESAAQKERATALGQTLEVAQGQVESVRKELSAAETAIGELESAQAGIRAEADAAQNELSTQEIALAENRQRVRFLDEETGREFQAEPATLDWKRELWRAEDEPEGLKPLDLDEEAEGEDGGQTQEGGEVKSRRKRKPKAPRGEPTETDLAAMDTISWDEIKAEIEGLRQRMHAMGAVNLVAIEEYAELKQRHDFLTAQSTDLSNARSELLGIIDEINRTSLRQFEVTFEQIRKNFSYTFQELFGGGRAALDLIEAEDILESGIEIVAQPPGTRLKGISLLSGGQKTLTAVALLFALYMVKPSPFCLLDELDAPLDESNIGRFTALLGKFVKDSQFIIITHNKRTVASADAIYGVTMEERGVSKTVSMRFNHERGEAEHHTPNLAEAVSGAGVS